MGFPSVPPMAESRSTAVKQNPHSPAVAASAELRNTKLAPLRWGCGGEGGNKLSLTDALRFELHGVALVA